MILKNLQVCWSKVAVALSWHFFMVTYYSCLAVTTIKLQDFSHKKFISLWKGNYVWFLNSSCVLHSYTYLHTVTCILKWIRGKENVKMPNCWKIYPLLTFKTGTWKYNLFPWSFGARGMTLVILIENRLMWMEKCCSLKRVFCQTFNLCVRLFQNLYRTSTKQAILYDYWKDKVIMQGEGPLLPSVRGGILRAVALSIICLLLRL